MRTLYVWDPTSPTRMARDSGSVNQVAPGWPPSDSGVMSVDGEGDMGASRDAVPERTPRLVPREREEERRAAVDAPGAECSVASVWDADLDVDVVEGEILPRHMPPASGPRE